MHAVKREGDRAFVEPLRTGTEATRRAYSIFSARDNHSSHGMGRDRERTLARQAAQAEARVDAFRGALRSEITTP